MPEPEAFISKVHYDTAIEPGSIASDWVVLQDATLGTRTTPVFCKAGDRTTFIHREDGTYGLVVSKHILDRSKLRALRRRHKKATAITYAQAMR